MQDKLIKIRSLTNEDKFFLFICNLYKAEASSHPWTHISITIVRFLIYIGSIFNLNLGTSAGVNKLSQSLMGVFISCSLLVIIASLSILGYYWKKVQKLDFDNPVPQKIQVLNSVLKLHMTFITPVLVWASVTWCLQPPRSAAQLSVVSFLTVVSVAFSCSLKFLLHDPTPTGALSAVMDVSHKGVIYLVCKIIIGLGIVTNSTLSGTIKLLLQLVNSMICLCLVFYFTFTRNFWSDTSNTFILICHLELFLFSALQVVITLKVPLAMAFCVAPLIFFFFIKLAVNRVNSIRKTKIFGRNISVWNKIYGVSTMEQILSLDLGSPHEGELKQFYLGVMKDQINKNPYKELNCLEAVLDSRQRVRYLVGYLIKETVDIRLMRLCFYLLLLQPLENFIFLRTMLARLKVSLGRSFKGRLELYHLNLIVEAALGSLYFMKVKSFSQKRSLQTFYTDTLLESSKEVGEDYTNINYALQCKQVFLEVVSKLCDLVDKSKAVFSYLIAARKQNKELIMYTLFNLNNTVKEANNTFEEVLQFSNALINSRPKYFFSPLYAYYATIVFSPSKTREMITKYKIASEQHQGRKNSSIDKVVVFDWFRTVTLQIGMSQFNTGCIINASPNADLKLELKKGPKPILGRNINELFVPVMAEKHAHMMANLGNLDNHLNKNNTFFIRNLSSCLKEIEYKLKLHPQLGDDLSMVANLNILQKSNNFLIITDNNLNIIDAEYQVSGYLDVPYFAYRGSVNLQDVDFKLSLVIRLQPMMEKMQQLIKLQERNRMLSLDNLKESVEKFLTLNENEKLALTVGAHRSEKTMSTDSYVKTVTVRTMRLKFGDLLYYKIYTSVMREFNLDKMEDNDRTALQEQEERSDLEVTGSFKRKKSRGVIDKNQTDFVPFSKTGEKIVHCDQILEDLWRVLSSLLGNSLKNFEGEWRLLLEEMYKLLEQYREKEEKMNFSDIMQKANTALTAEKTMQPEVNEKTKSKVDEVAILERSKNRNTFPERKAFGNHYETDRIQGNVEEENRVIPNSPDYRKGRKMNLYKDGKMKVISKELMTPPAMLPDTSNKAKKVTDEWSKVFKRKTTVNLEPKTPSGLNPHRISERGQNSNSERTFPKNLDQEERESRMEDQRKVRILQMAKQHKRDDKFGIIYWINFIFFLATIAASLIGANNLISSHMVKTNDLFMASKYLGHCNFYISYTLMGYFGLKNSLFCGNNNLYNMTRADAILGNLTYSSNYNSTINQTTLIILDQMRDTIGNLTQLVEQSSALRSLGFTDLLFVKICQIKINELLPPGDRNPQENVDILQMMKVYNNWMQASLSVNASRLTNITDNISRFLMTKSFDVLLKEVGNVMVQARNTLDAEGEFYQNSYRNTLIITTLLVVLNFIFWLVTMLYHRRMYGDIFSTFAVLDSKAVHTEMKRLSSILTLFNSQIFDSRNTLRKARVIAAEFMPDQTIGIEEARMNYEEEVNTKVQKSGPIKGERKEQLRMAQTSRFRYGFPIRVFIWIFLLNIALLGFWGIEAYIVSRIGAIVTTTNTIRYLAMQNTEFGVQFMKNFAMSSRISPFPLKFYTPVQVKGFADMIELEQTKLSYINWWTAWESTLLKILGTGDNNEFEIFQNSPICTMKNPDPHWVETNPWPSGAEADCPTMYGGILQKGFFHFVLEETARMSDYSDILGQTLTNGISSNTSLVQIQKNMAKIWFGKEYSKLRVWHRYAFSRVVRDTSSHFELRINQRTQSTIDSILILLVVGLLIMLIPLAFFLMVILPKVKENYLTCLAAFDLISPQSIIGNQLVQMRFKKFYNVFTG